MFFPDLSVAELIFRAAAVYLVLFVLLRFISKKHVGQLSPFDLVVLLIISETVDGSLIGGDESLAGGLISAATLIALVQIVGYCAWANKTVERWVEGRPKVLVRHGHVKTCVMNGEQVTRSELMEALRQHSCSALTGVRSAMLENDGSITVAKRRRDR